MIERLALKERHVEFVGHQSRADMVRQSSMTLDRRQVARAAAFVGDRVAVADAEREGRVMIEEERGDVVVIDDEQNVGLLVGEPFLHWLEVVEDRLPDRIVFFVAVIGEADGRGMRGRDGADDGGHVICP